MNKHIYDQLLELSVYCMRFAEVNRATSNLDGITPESDTDHTVMLGIVGCAFAARLAPELNLGKIAQFALVHDFTEVITGDVDTLMPFDASEKALKEKEALETLRTLFGNVPWLHTTMQEYESLASPEARFVKVLDKVLPKITQLASNGKTLTARGMGSWDLKVFMDKQFNSIVNSYGFDQPAVMDFAKDMSERLLNMMISKEINNDTTSH